MSETPDLSSSTERTSTPLGKLLRAFFAALEEADIRYCVLRNYGGLPDRTTHDVDLLIEPRKAREAMALLVHLASQEGWRLVRRNMRFKYSWMFFILSQSISTRLDLIRIDFLWSDRIWRGIPVISFRCVLEKRLRYHGFYVASPGAEAAVTLAKEYLQNGELGPADKLARNRTRIAHGVNSDHVAFLEALRPHFGARLAAEMAERVASEDWEWFRRHIRQVRARVIARSLFRNPVGQMITWARFLWGHFNDKLLRPSGFLIALIGPDGSGKTTISRALERHIADHLNEAFPRVVYRHGRFGILPELKVLYNAMAMRLGLPKKCSLSQEEATRLLDGPPFHPLRAAVYLAYYTLDYLLGYIMVWRERARGHIILFDRYYYDYLIHRTYDRIPWAIRKMLLGIVPRPQIVIYLKGDPEVIHRRKPELRPDQIAEQQSRCEELMGNDPRYAICATDASLDASVACAFAAFCAFSEHQATRRVGPR